MRWCAALALPLVAACGADNLKPPPPPADQLYWDIALNHRAVLLSTTAPYDTLMLTVTPRNAAGDPLPGAPPVRYTSQDENTVVVLDNGVLRAVKAGVQPVWVVATLTWGQVTHTDSVYVKVVDQPAPPVLASFSIHPLPPDSAKVAVGLLKSLPVRAADVNGAPMTDLLVSFRPASGSDRIATVDPTTGAVTGQSLGRITIDASTTVFGVTKVDTVAYRVGYPVGGTISFEPDPSNSTLPELRLGTGALVLWAAISGNQVPIDITFAEDVVSNVVPGNTTMLGETFFGPAFWDFICSIEDCAGSGNILIPASSGSGGALRVLAAPGTYEYYSAAVGKGGRIIVVDER